MYIQLHECKYEKMTFFVIVSHFYDVKSLVTYRSPQQTIQYNNKIDSFEHFNGIFFLVENKNSQKVKTCFIFITKQSKLI